MHPLGFILLDIPGPVGGGRKDMQKYLGLNLGFLYGHFSMSYSGVWTTGRYVERVERHAAVKPESINQLGGPEQRTDR